MTIDILRVIARNLCNARRNRLEGNVARANAQEESAERALSARLRELGYQRLRQVTSGVANALVLDGVPVDDLADMFDAIDNANELAMSHLVADALLTEWEGTMSEDGDTALALGLPCWKAVEFEVKL